MSWEKYREYVKEHIANVQEVWKDLITQSKEEKCDYFFNESGSLGISKGDYNIIDRLIVTHDISKSDQEEFFGYAQWFFPDNKDVKNKDIFDYAWNHHQKANPHHWQYWIMWKHNESIVLQMNFYYVIEMLCDWTAMSYKFGDKPSDFYEKNQKEMLLHDGTALCIKKWIPLFDQLAEKRKTLNP